MFRKRNELFFTYNNTAKAKDMGAKLKETMKFPKMCASKSINITDGSSYVKYYRG